MIPNSQNRRSSLNINLLSSLKINEATKTIDFGKKLSEIQYSLIKSFVFYKEVKSLVKNVKKKYNHSFFN